MESGEETKDPNYSGLLALRKEFVQRQISISDSAACASPASRSDISSISSRTSRNSPRSSNLSSSRGSCGDLRDRLSSNGGTIFLGSQVFLRPAETAVDGESAMTMQEASEKLQLPMLDMSQDDLGGLKQWADQVCLWRMACESLLKEMESRLNHLEESKAKCDAALANLKAELRQEQDNVQRMITHRVAITQHMSNTKAILDKLNDQYNALTKDLRVRNTAEHAHLRDLLQQCEDSGKKFFNSSFKDRIAKVQGRLDSLEPVVEFRRRVCQSNRQLTGRLKDLRSKLAARQSELSNAKQLLHKLLSKSVEGSEQSVSHLTALSSDDPESSIKQTFTAELIGLQKKQKDLQEQHRRQLQRQRQLRRLRERARRLTRLKESELLLDQKLQELRLQRLKLLMGAQGNKPIPAAASTTKPSIIVEKRRRMRALQRQMTQALRQADQHRKLARLRARVKRAEAAAASVARSRDLLTKRRQSQSEARRIGAIVERLFRSGAGGRQLQLLFANLRAKLGDVMKRLELGPLRQVKSRSYSSKAINARRSSNTKIAD